VRTSTSSRSPGPSRKDEIAVRCAGRAETYRIASGDHQDYLDLFRRLAADFGTRTPHVYEGPLRDDSRESSWRPLILENDSGVTT